MFKRSQRRSTSELHTEALHQNYTQKLSKRREGGKERDKEGRYQPAPMSRVIHFVNIWWLFWGVLAKLKLLGYNTTANAILISQIASEVTKSSEGSTTSSRPALTTLAWGERARDIDSFRRLAERKVSADSTQGGLTRSLSSATSHSTSSRSRIPPSPCSSLCTWIQ